jgi:hypothetical protein
VGIPEFFDNGMGHKNQLSAIGYQLSAKPKPRCARWVLADG